MQSAHATQVAKPKMRGAGEFLRARLMDAGRSIKNSRLPIVTGVSTALTLLTAFTVSSPSKTELFNTFVNRYSVKNLSRKEILDIRDIEWRAVGTVFKGREYVFLADEQTLNGLRTKINELYDYSTATAFACDAWRVRYENVTVVIPLDIKAAHGERRFTITLAREYASLGVDTVGGLMASAKSTTSSEATLDFGGVNARNAAIRAIDAARKDFWGVKSMSDTPAGADSGLVYVGEAPDIGSRLKRGWGWLKWPFSVGFGIMGGAVMWSFRESRRTSKQRE